MQRRLTCTGPQLTPPVRFTRAAGRRCSGATSPLGWRWGGGGVVSHFGSLRELVSTPLAPPTFVPKDGRPAFEHAPYRLVEEPLTLQLPLGLQHDLHPLQGRRRRRKHQCTPELEDGLGLHAVGLHASRIHVLLRNPDQ